MVSIAPPAKNTEPKGVVARANLKLWQCIRNAARGIECDFEQGTLTMSGRLATALQCERAVAAVREIGAVKDVNANIQVGLVN